MNANRFSCPLETELADFALGRLDLGSAEAIGCHVQTCDGCRRFVASVSGDGFVSQLRRAANPDVSREARRSSRDESVSATGQPGETLAGGGPSQSASAGQASREPSGLFAPPELANHPDYELLKELGRGGMGVVYLARNRMMDRPEVLKVVSRALLDRPGALERFQQEIRSAARLQHPNIVAAYAVLRVGDLLVLAMEYVPGEDLSKLVARRGALPVVNAAYYAQQTALGLQHAHEKGMVHRDIKPNNLMLAQEGKKHIVKILDFGLAKATSEKQAAGGLTRTGQMLGTPDYVAPEQMLDAQKADIRADIYSLGCTLYFMLAGRPPFEGNSLYEILQAHHVATARPLNAVRPDVPPDMAAVVARMMAKRPEERYQTPGEVAKALAPFFKPGSVGGQQPSAPGTPARESPSIEAVAPVAIVAVSAMAAPQTPVAIPAGLVPSIAMSGLPFPGALVPPAGQPASSAPRSPSAVRLRGSARGKARRKKASGGRRWIQIAATAGGLIPLALLASIMLKPGGSEHGTVTLKVSEPIPNVRVDDDPVAVAWSAEGKSAELRVKPGSHKITLRKSGFRPVDEEVEVVAGGKSVLVARLEPDVASVATTPHSPERPVRISKAVLEGHKNAVTRLLFSHTGAELFSASNGDVDEIHAIGSDNSVRIWDVATGAHVCKFEMTEGGHYGPQDMTLSRDGHLLAASASWIWANRYPEPVIYVWSVDNHECVSLLKPPGDRAMRALCFSKDGKKLFARRSGVGLHSWSLPNCQEGPTIDLESCARNEMPTAMVFSPGGDTVLSALWGPGVGVWDRETGKLLKRFEGPAKPANAISLSNDGRTVTASARDSSLWMWDFDSGRALFNRENLECQLLSVAFSADAKRILTGGEDSVVRLWDASKGTETASFRGHTDKVLSVAFSPDGALAASGSADTTVRLWSLSSNPRHAEEPASQSLGTADTAGRVSDFVPLFNGRDLTGWHPRGDQASGWRVENNMLIGSGPAMSLLRSDRANYQDFHLRAECRVNSTGSGGIYFRVPLGDGWIRGYKAQINCSGGDPAKTGSLLTSDLFETVRESPVPANAWFRLEVIAIGQHIVIKVNDKITCDFNDSRAAFLKGQLALRHDGVGTAISFRSIEIRELPAAAPNDPPEKSGFAPMFNGRDLSGWVQRGGHARFDVEDGAIVGVSDPNAADSFLSTAKEYADFTLQLEFKIDDGLNSGVQIRSQSFPTFKNGVVHGYQVEIDPNGVENPRQYTGAIYDEGRRNVFLSDISLSRAAQQTFRRNDWNTLLVACDGDSIMTWLNGWAAADLRDSTTRSGFIALEVHSTRSAAPLKVRFRKIEIKESTAPASALDANLLLKKGSTWVDEAQRRKLAVTERDGESFRARFQIGENIDREVKGTMRGDRVVWQGKDVRAIKGNIGGDTFGVLSRDEKGPKIDFSWQEIDGKQGGLYTLRLQTN